MNNEKGVTLIEILAALVLLAIISTIVFNLILAGQKENIKQVSANTELQDVSYTFKLLTKDIRKGTKVYNGSNPNEFNIVDIHHNVLYSYTYDTVDKQILRNNVVITKNVPSFSYTLDPNFIKLTIQNNQNDIYKTIFYFR